MPVASEPTRPGRAHERACGPAQVGERCLALLPEPERDASRASATGDHADLTGLALEPERAQASAVDAQRAPDGTFGEHADADGTGVPGHATRDGEGDGHEGSGSVFGSRLSSARLGGERLPLLPAGHGPQQIGEAIEIRHDE